MDDTNDARGDAEPDARVQSDDVPEHDPEAVSATTGVYRNPLMRVYAFCRGGFVRSMRLALAHEPHPFGDLGLHASGQIGDPTRDHVVDVTGAVCYPGMVVDNKGNVGPAPIDGEPLTMRDPAYHDRQVVPAVPTDEAAALLSRPPIDGDKPAPHGATTDARIEAQPKAEEHKADENRQG